jgi:hypothetical protein
MMDHNTSISLAGGIIVLFGVYAVFRLLRYVADVVIILIAIADAVVACNIHSWYAALAETLGFLPPEFGIKGWAICVGALTVLGAVIAVPLIPFSSIIRSVRSHGSRREHRMPDGRPQVRLSAPGNTRFYQWDSYHDL